jgi:hypothetical protein
MSWRHDSTAAIRGAWLAPYSNVITIGSPSFSGHIGARHRKP